jgi:PAS domain-containing protein
MSDLFFPVTLDRLCADLVAALPVLAVGVFVVSRLRAKISHLTGAVNHMSQGLCMFSASGHLVVCNRQYLRMHNLSPDIVKPGCTLFRLLEHRRK